MGCDIHTYIEVTRTSPDGKEFTWYAGDIDLGRNYTLFALMAGVRYDPLRMDGHKPMFEPRGLPDNAGWWVSTKYTLYVADERNQEEWEGWVAPEDAQRWVKEGYSQWWDGDQKKVTNPDWHSASWLSVEELEQVRDVYAGIKFYDASWYQWNAPDEQPVPAGAKVTETKSIIGSTEWLVQVGEPKTREVPASLNALIAAMKELDKPENCKSRLVFWFDN